MIDSTIKIENIVASMALSDHFDLQHISSSLENADYDKNKFPGLVYRIKDPKTAFLVFSSGKANCTGAKSIEDVDVAIKMLSEDLRGLGYTINRISYTIQNIVAGASIDTELDLDAIAIGLGFENVEYEPEVFPGLVYRIRDPKVVVLIFRSGKLVITGAKTPEECEFAKMHVWQQLDNLGLV
ncbi:TATA-box-binding protein [ANME-2 cluster archaeon]|nr:MAG: TATA-box-binding protein [ANME-2 cluster archaeon]RLG22685.1 MAG: TATA-box-binding protein [Methanosarcinales archaeon]